MLLVSESRVPPRGHHAIDKDAAAIMRIKNVMMSTLPAIPFLPNLLVLSVPPAGRSAETWNDLPGALHTVYMIPDTLGFPSRHKQADFEGNTLTEPVVLRALHRGWEDCPGGRGDRGSL
jgi:hypothetical protein